MNANSIPAGYQLQLTTYEGDLDAKMTKVISGLSKEDTLFYIDLAQEVSGCIEDWNIFFNSVNKVVQRHPDISEDAKQKFDTSVGFEEAKKTGLLYENVCEHVIGGPVNEGISDMFPLYCRAYEDHEVFYIPEACENVTDQFNI